MRDRHKDGNAPVVIMLGLSLVHEFQHSLLSFSRRVGAGAAAERTCIYLQKNSSDEAFLSCLTRL